MKPSAHGAVSAALKRGELVKKPCEHCGSEYRVEGHHPDYDKPLDVIWLCKSCHEQEHRRIDGRGSEIGPHLETVPFIRKFVSDCGSQKEAAKRLGCSPQYVGQMYHGQRRVPDAMLETLGLRRSVIAAKS